MSEIRPGGGSPFEPGRAEETAAKPGSVAARVAALSKTIKAAESGAGSLAGRAKMGPVKQSEELSNKELKHLYDTTDQFAPRFELAFRAHKSGDYSWQTEEGLENDRANFGYDRAAASGDPNHQAMLALRYLVGLGTEPSEEKFVRVMKGLDPDSGLKNKGWVSLEDSPVINYAYFRFLRDFQGADLLDESRPSAKALVLIDCLQKAAEGGQVAALQIWNSRVGEEFRAMRTSIAKSLR